MPPISHAWLEAGAADAHDARPGGGPGCASSASFLFGDPGGEHQEHQWLRKGFRAAGFRRMLA